MGGQVSTPKLSLEGGGQLRTPKLSLADAGGGPPSSDIVTTFALFLMVRLPLLHLILDFLFHLLFHLNSHLLTHLAANLLLPFVLHLPASPHVSPLA